tara:strand:+ start:820 stop:1776 length:957 start_codon:yes stop_codon:yes gene_type:complete
MIIVTGGAGFIGSNIVHGLNDRGIKDIMIVDDLTQGQKMHNLSDLDFIDYIDVDEFLNFLSNKKSSNDIKAIFHQGACSSTDEWDGKYLMRNNFSYSKSLLEWSNENNTQFIYASSASVYGNGTNGFRESRECEHPINMYAFSKFQFDQYVRAKQKKIKTQVAGLRYFNVYGPRENFKGSQSSTAFHFYNQVNKDGLLKLFKGTDGYIDGMQMRDFIYVKDCIKVNLWLLDNPNISGTFNVGTGEARTFNDMGNAVIASMGKGKIEYIEFPKHLEGSYQNYTQADMSALRRVGYKDSFFKLEDGVADYIKYLNKCEFL